MNENSHPYDPYRNEPADPGTPGPADGPAAPEAAQGPFNAPESSLDDPSLFTPPYELTEGEVASPGYNAGGGGRR